MKVNHLNLTVTDLVETQQFFVKYFGLQLLPVLCSIFAPFCARGDKSVFISHPGGSD